MCHEGHGILAILATALSSGPRIYPLLPVYSRCSVLFVEYVQNTEVMRVQSLLLVRSASCVCGFIVYLLCLILNLE